ncbi:MAG: FAD-binding protein [Pseudomonadota bacterium]
MKSDVLIIGAELDGLLAALRLRDLGFSVRLLCSDTGSLSYVPGGIRLLGNSDGTGLNPVIRPFEGLSALPDQHPYSLVGTAAVKTALQWFFERCDSEMELQRPNGQNQQVPSSAGQPLSFYAPLKSQLSFQKLKEENVILVSFQGHQDFAGKLVAQELSTAGVLLTEVELPSLGGRTDTVGIARAFDRVEDFQNQFQPLFDLATDHEAKIVLFPAVLGLKRHQQVLREFSDQGLTCGEIPTLPPSVPGLRFTQNLQSQLAGVSALIHPSTKVDGFELDGNRVRAVFDDKGQRYDCSTLILSNGGILMGGLEVSSRHVISETSLGLEAIAATGVGSGTIEEALDGLHRSGIEVDEQLRPTQIGHGTIENLFVTGATLAHWNPIQEASAEGVSIATAWAAAQASQSFLEAQ